MASLAQNHPESGKVWICTWTGLIPEPLSLSHQVGEIFEGQGQSGVTQPQESDGAKLWPPVCHVPRMPFSYWQTSTCPLKPHLLYPFSLT